MSFARVELITSKNRITVAEIARIFMHADWTKKRAPSQIRRMLNNTDILILAKFQGRPVGFTRLITDQIFRAFVEDVIVVPDMRRRGVARAMMVRAEQMVKKLGIPRMELTTTQTAMWKKLGYERKQKTTYMVKTLRAKG